MEQIDLTPLKGLHIMTQPSWWPPAYGWWVILGCVVVLGLGIYGLYKWWIRRPIVYALRELNIITNHAADDLEFLQAISLLMKRVAILKYGREEIAPLNEKGWQDCLVSTVRENFSVKDARLIACSPYVTKIKERLDRKKMETQAAKWISETLKNKNSLDKCQKNR